jgi:hypothetical protein
VGKEQNTINKMNSTKVEIEANPVPVEVKDEK